MIMVRKNELACRDEWSHDLWEPIADPTGASAPRPFSGHAADRRMPPATEVEIAAVLRAESSPPEADTAANADDVVLSELGLPAPPLSRDVHAEAKPPWSAISMQPAAASPTEPRPGEQGDRHAILRAREAFRERSRLSARASELARLAAQAEAGPPSEVHTWKPELDEHAPRGVGDPYAPTAASAAAAAATATWTADTASDQTLDDAAPGDSDTAHLVRDSEPDVAPSLPPAPPARSVNQWDEIASVPEPERRFDPTPPIEDRFSQADWTTASQALIHSDRLHFREGEQEDPAGLVTGEQDRSAFASDSRAEWRVDADDPASPAADALPDVPWLDDAAYDNTFSGETESVSEDRVDDALTNYESWITESVVVDDDANSGVQYSSISAHLPHLCRHCRDFRPAETGERGWCANQWAFSHRRMVNATEQTPCETSLGDWWLPVDEVWSEAADVSSHGQPTPLLDALLPQHPERISTRRRS